MPDEIIDCRGIRCPLPVLKMEKRLGQITPGATVIVLATDPIAKIDIPLFCTQNGHGFEMSIEGDVMRFVITKSHAG
ncbi:MAG: sulfurtransferase TusA family protein [Devosia sp.]